jgi:hypothetical protein
VVIKRAAPLLELLAAPKYLALFVRDFAAGLRDEAHQSCHETFRVVRRSYVVSRGRSRRGLRWLYRRLRPAVTSSQYVDQTALNALRRDGLAIVSHFLTPETTSALFHYFQQLPAQPVGGSSENAAPVTIGAATHVLRLVHPTRSVLSAPGIGELLANRAIQHLAAAYLGCEPIFTGVHAWWSLADADADAERLSEAAQLFHFDCEWPAFVKFFFYLRDVGPHDGPFTFVLGTHEAKRHWRHGRVSDEYIAQHYGKSIRSITGSAGDMIVADTAGYHKGERVSAGPRLILQLEFCVARMGPALQYERYPRALRPASDFRHTFDVFCEP